MSFPTKEYYRLRNLQHKWGVSQEDIFYAIQNGLLRVCIWLPMRYVERCVMKDRKFVLECHEHKEGFVGIRAKDCHRICSNGNAKLRIFNSIRQENHILKLAHEPPQPSIHVRIGDLVVLKGDRERFEETYDIEETRVVDIMVEKAEALFKPSKDYRYLYLRGKEYHLGDIQARVIEQLHDASQSENPWVHGKTLIHESGSRAVRLRDLFNKKGQWKALIISNGRGCYRLNIPLEEFDYQPAASSIQRKHAAQ